MARRASPVRRAARAHGPPGWSSRPSPCGQRFAVVRADALAGRKLVHREPKLLGADQRPDPLIEDVVAVRIVVVLGQLDLEEVDLTHDSPSQYSRSAPTSNLRAKPRPLTLIFPLSG